MPTLPPELVSMIFEILFESDRPPWSNIPGYATVSLEWLDRVRARYFELVSFRNQDDLEKWKRTFGAQPLGVKQYVRRISFHNVQTLRGFCHHPREFPNLEEVQFHKCYFCGCPEEMESFEKLGGRDFTQLAISGSSMNLVSLLGAVPHLRRLSILGDRCNNIRLSRRTARTFIFERPVELELLLEDYPERSLEWIPSDVQFSSLSIGTVGVRQRWDVLNRWLRSSRETLNHFSIEWDSNDCFFPIWVDVNLKHCMSLSTLQFPVPLNDPCKVAKIVLADMPPSLPAKIGLRLEMVGEELDQEGWQELEHALCELAGWFKDENDGKSMSVEVYLDRSDNFGLFDSLMCGQAMPELCEEADVVVLRRSKED